jgi:hypothetical protein
MKKIIFLIIVLFCFNSKAQNYSFSLVQNNGYSFSVVAIPDFDSGAFEPVVQFYGFTIVLPAGTSVIVDDIQPSGLTLIGDNYNLVSGSSLTGVDASMSNKDLLVFTTVASSGIAITAHSNGEQIPLITFTVNGDPTTGVLTLLDNGSPVSSAFAAFESYLTVDAIDNSIFSATDLYIGQSGMTSFDFSTLSLEELILDDSSISVYPNPVENWLTINGDYSNINSVEIYSMSGQLVTEITNGFGKIDAGNLQPGIYFLKVKTDTLNKTIKFIKE